MGEKNSLYNKWHWDNQIVTCKRMKLDLYSKLYTQINSKWIINTMYELKLHTALLEISIGVNLYDLRLGKISLDTMTKAQMTKQKNR